MNAKNFTSKKCHRTSLQLKTPLSSEVQVGLAPLVLTAKLRPSLSGSLEQWSTVRHSLGFYHAVGMTARYHSPPSTSPDAGNTTGSANSVETLKAYIYPALRKVIDQHPPLSVSLVDESAAEPHFVRLRHIDLDSIVSFVELPEATDNAEDRDEELDRVAADNHSRQFERLGELPLWRLIVLIPPHWRNSQTPSHSASETVPNTSGVDVALFIHHAVGDGGSAQIFHSSLLAALNSAEGTFAETSPSSVVDVRTEVPFLPPMDQIIDLRVSWLALLIAIFKPLFFRPPRSLWTGPPVRVPDTPAEADSSKPANGPSSGPYKVQTRMSHFVLDASTATAITKQCRKNGTTMTGLLETLMSVAFFEYLTASGNSEAKTLNCVCAMNARRFMGQKASGGGGEYDNQMGVFLEATEHSFARSDISVGPSSGSAGSKAENSDANGEVALDWKAVWDVARKVKDKLEKKIKKGMQDSPWGLLRYASNIRGLIQGYLGQKRGPTFEVSNIGLVDGGLERKETGWSISRMIFSQSANVIGPVIAFSVCSIKGGDMCVMGSWQEDVIEAQVAQDVVGRVKVLLESVAALD